jgi:hypothetical protein
MPREQAIFEFPVETPNVPTFIDEDGRRVAHIIVDSSELDALESLPPGLRRNMLRWRSSQGALPRGLQNNARAHVFFGLPGPHEFPIPPIPDPPQPGPPELNGGPGPEIATPDEE